MNRAPLRELLTAYNPDNALEESFKLEMLAFINEHHDCFERSLIKGHITASAWLLNADHSQALLMHHSKLDQWFQLGGHCDGDSDVLGVAIKEAREESGIASIQPVSADIFDIDIHEIPPSKSTPAHLHYDVRFLLHVTDTQHVVQNHESKELRWISQDIHTLPPVNSSVLRMFTKWLNRHS